MSDEMNIDAYITSPFSKDLQKQRDAALESARNIRKVTETPEEYRIRMAQQEEAHRQQLRSENTDVLQQRLANLDISNIATKNRAAIESMIAEAESIKFYALYNNYDMSLKKGEDKRDIGTGIYADTYRTAKQESDNLLNKLLGGTSNSSSNSPSSISSMHKKI